MGQEPSNTLGKRQLAVNLAANVTAFVVQMGISFFFTPYLVKSVGKEAYSFFPLAMSITGYAGIITIALNSMASRFITFKVQQNDLHGANIYYSSVLAGNTVIALFLTVPSVLSVIFIDKLLNMPPAIVGEVQMLFGLIFAASLLSIVTSVYGVATFARNRLELSSMRNAESNVIRVVMLIGLYYFFRPSISYIGIANLVVAVFLIIMNIRYTRLLMPGVRIRKEFIRLSAIRDLVSSGIWNSLNQLSNVLMSGLDLLLANILLGAAVSGTFAIAKTVPLFFQSFIGMLVGVFVPELMILYAREQWDEFRASLDRSMKFMQILLSVPMGFLVVFGDTFFNLWVPGQNAQQLHVMIVMIIAPMVITTSIETLFHTYTITNRLKIPAFALFITGVVNVALMIGLIRFTSLGVMAIPLSGLITGVIKHTTFTPLYAAHVLHLKRTTFYRPIFRGIVAFASACLVSLLVRLTLSPGNWTLLVISFLIIVPVAVFLNAHLTLNKGERAILRGIINSAIHKFKITTR